MPVYLVGQARTFVGVLRDEAPLPVVAEGNDYDTSSWTEVSSQIGAVEVAFDDHEHTARLHLLGAITDSATWLDDRQVIIRGRWRQDTGTWTTYQVVFAGYVTGAGNGQSVGTMHKAVHSGVIECRQEWHYFQRTRIPATQYGWLDVARGKSTTASSTLPTVASSPEVGLEYLTTTSVGPDQAVDGNRDTVWISNTVADPTPPVLIQTGKRALITEVYNGRGNAGTLGANGQPLWIELTVADVVLADGFESGINAAWKSVRGANLAIDGSWAAAGANSLRVTSTQPGGGVQRDVNGLQPSVEVAVTFTVRSNTGANIVLDAGLAGDGPTIWQKVTAPTATSGARYTMRRLADRNGQINLRIAVTNQTDAFFLDEVRVSGGMVLAENGGSYKKCFLVWDDGLGGSGYGDLASKLGVESIGGDRTVILCDDADLFRSQFDAGDSTIVQMRNLDGDQGQSLRLLDFASGRGRLRLAYYRRWPDLPGTGGTIWDDVQFASQPAFTATQSLVRTAVAATFQARNNPAPGGAETAGTAWLQVDLGSYAAPTITASMGTSTPLDFEVTSTDKFPKYGNAYIDNEVMWLEKLGPTTFRATRSAPVAHTSGSTVHPQLDGVKVTLPLLSVVGWRRRPGVPTIVDFDIIGSSLASPRDPAVAVGGGTWGSHPDWFLLSTVRGWSAPSFAAEIGPYGSWAPTAWPPASGTTTNWGKQVRWLRLVIHKMQTWNGAAQRAKVNELLAFEADLSSSGAGEFAGQSPADLRGIAGNLILQYGRVAATQLQIQRGDGLPVSWGGRYGTLQFAPSTVAEALANLEERGRMRIYCSMTGYVRVVPDPMSTSAVWDTATVTWDATNTWELQTTREAAHQVAQVLVTGRNEGESATYRSAYPRSPALLGAVVDVSDVVAGNQSDVDARAAREFRQRNARWQGVVTVGPQPPPLPVRRHIINYAAGDLNGVDLSGRNFLVTAYSWRYEPGEFGGTWSTSVTLEELSA